MLVFVKIRFNLEHLTDYTVDYFKNLKKKYGAAFPRRTRLEEFETIQAQTVVVANSKLYCSREEGFVGTDPKKMGNPEYMCDCSDIDDIIVFLKNGDYVVTNVKDKEFIGNDIIYAGVFKKGDDRTIYNAIYRDGKGGPYFVKRFAVTGVTRNKTYNLTQGKPGSRVEWFTANGNGEAESVRVYFRNRPGIRKTTDAYDFANLAIKGRSSRGNLLTRNPIQRIQLKSAGVSTIGGKEIWFDEDIQRLNDAGRGISLGEFQQDDKILVVLKSGNYYTTSFDLSNRYQGDIIRIEKLDPTAVYSVAYYDKESKFFYVKRFSFEVSDNKEQCFISEAPGSKFCDICCDSYPRLEVTFKGKNASHEPDIIDVAEFIGKKSFKAKGRRVSNLDVAKTVFIEPLPEPEFSVEDEIDEDTIELVEDDAPVAAEPVSTEEAAKILESNAAPEEDADEDRDDGPIELTLF